MTQFNKQNCPLSLENHQGIYLKVRPRERKSRVQAALSSKEARRKEAASLTTCLAVTQRRITVLLLQFQQQYNISTRKVAPLIERLKKVWMQGKDLPGQGEEKGTDIYSPIPNPTNNSCWLNQLPITNLKPDGQGTQELELHSVRVDLTTPSRHKLTFKRQRGKSSC